MKPRVLIIFFLGVLLSGCFTLGAFKEIDDPLMLNDYVGKIERAYESNNYLITVFTGKMGGYKSASKAVSYWLKASLPGDKSVNIQEGSNNLPVRLYSSTEFFKGELYINRSGLHKGVPSESELGNFKSIPVLELDTPEFEEYSEGKFPKEGSAIVFMDTAENVKDFRFYYVKKADASRYLLRYRFVLKNQEKSNCFTTVLKLPFYIVIDALLMPVYLVLGIFVAMGFPG